ncbi:hypothetical protein EJB05_35389, partial [Eragrostis curvula]
MNLAESPSPSPSSSSGSDDFAALLDSELELASAGYSATLGDASVSPTGGDDDEEQVKAEVEALEENSTKRPRVEELHQDQATSVTPGKDTAGSSKDVQGELCPHLGFVGGLCFTCGKPQDEEDVSGVAFDYIHKGLRLSTSEIDRLRGADLKNLLRERKLRLILDLDHTLINSTRLQDITPAENKLDDPNRSIFTLESMHMLTKLRPFVNKFLEEASDMFEMYIYTMADKAYAIEIAKLLDPGNIYFSSKIISNTDCTQQHQKGLDVVWKKHKENLILMERYHYFGSSCKQFGRGVKSLSELMQDERESDGALATILHVLKRIHAIFFDSAIETDLSSRDVRQVIKAVRKHVLQGCKLVFSRVFPRNARPQDQFIWKMAEQLGAICCTDLDSTVTHVVALDPGTDKAHWAAVNKKFLVHPRWIEAANFRWCRQPEEDFPVRSPEGKVKDKENSVAGEKKMDQDKQNVVPGQEKKEETVHGQEKEEENALATTTTCPTDS